MASRLLILSCLIIFLIGGCIFLDEKLLTLKKVGDSQKEIDRHLYRQEKLFKKLVKNFKGGRLTAGITQKKFIKIYGEPILSRQAQGFDAREILLYRHPMRYFNSDRIYLYFDESKKLIHWEYEPAEQGDSSLK